MAEHDADTVRDVVAQLEEAKRHHGDALDKGRSADWGAILEKLKTAVELLDPGRPSDVDRRAGVQLVNEASAELRVHFGQIGSWNNDALRLAALDAHRRLDGLIGA
jgi:hypothetical protein